MRSLLLYIRRLLAHLDGRSLIWWLVAVQAFVVIAEVGSPGFASLLMLDGPAIMEGQVWRMVTWLCVPGTTGLVGALILLHFTFIAGQRLEVLHGSVRIASYLGVGAVCTAAVGL